MPGVLMWSRPQPNPTYRGPGRTYEPNVIEAELPRWRAKITGRRFGHPQVEIRTIKRSQLLAIVSLYEVVVSGNAAVRPGTKIRFTTNGPIELLDREWEEFGEAIEEARTVLRTLEETGRAPNHVPVPPNLTIGAIADLPVAGHVVSTPIRASMIAWSSDGTKILGWGSNRETLVQQISAAGHRSWVISVAPIAMV